MFTALRPLFRGSLLVASALCCLTALPGAQDASNAQNATSCFQSGLGWIAERTESICGLDDPKTLSNPAKVDYDALLKATPEYKKMKDEKIDPNSAEGIQLRQKGCERVRDACEKLRAAKGYCSVWKLVRHSDGRAVPDITDAVKDQL